VGISIDMAKLIKDVRKRILLLYEEFNHSMLVKQHTVTKMAVARQRFGKHRLKARIAANKWKSIY
jgi:hypothetical protein